MRLARNSLPDVWSRMAQCLQDHPIQTESAMISFGSFGHAFYGTSAPADEKELSDIRAFGFFCAAVAYGQDGIIGCVHFGFGLE